MSLSNVARASRRAFLAAVALSVLAAFPAAAQTLVEGQHYIRLKNPQPVGSGKKSAGALTAARAWGADVDLTIDVSAEDKYQCQYGERISLFDVLQQKCEEYAAEHPELALLCGR